MIHSAPRTVFWRLIWKEYRVQRAFWIGIAVLTVLLICLARFSVQDSHTRMQWQFGFALILPTLFAAACGGMLFAVDHEAGTYEFQRSLPVKPAHLMLSKFVFAFLSVMVLYAIGWLAALWLSGLPLADALKNLPAWALAGRLPVTGSHFVLGGVSLFFALELFLWSALFSLLLRRPLTAAIAGAAAAAVIPVMLGLTVAAATVTLSNTSSGYAKYAETIPLRAAVAAALAALDIWLGLRWLGERHITIAPRRFAWRLPAQRPDRFRTSSWMRVISRLLWEDWRQSRGLLLALSALCIPLAIDIHHYATRFDSVGRFHGVSMTVSSPSFLHWQPFHWRVQLRFWAISSGTIIGFWPTAACGLDRSGSAASCCYGFSPRCSSSHSLPSR